MRFILPLLIALIGAASGVGAGLYLKPAPAPGSGSETATDAHTAQPADAHSGEPDNHEGTVDATHGDGPHDAASGDTEFTKLNNQFIVPVLQDGRVVSMVVVSISLETTLGYREKVFALEPRLRDTFLQVLFDHANMGGFNGIFTSGSNMELLRRELKLASRKIAGQDILDVLITDIARQDL